MKRLIANTCMIGLTAIALVAQSCNDEVRNDHDANRTEENSKQLNGAEKPSDYTKSYDTVANNTVPEDTSHKY